MKEFEKAEANGELIIPACYKNVDFGRIENIGTNFNANFKINLEYKVPDPLKQY